jgi:O-antigen/teichoic acid export membrane protein
VHTEVPLEMSSESRVDAAVRTNATRVLGRSILGNFAALSAAELICRAVSVFVTLSLARRLGVEGYGRIEFAFQLAIWLTPLVRDGLDVLAAREIARHRRLVRSIVAHVLAVRLGLVVLAYTFLIVLGAAFHPGSNERVLAALYGLLLLTTALGLDYAFRGLERMGIVAISLVIRTAVYALGVAFSSVTVERLFLVPCWLIAGEAIGIAFVWGIFLRQYGRPNFHWRGRRFIKVFLSRCRSIYFIQISQSVLTSIDLIVIGWTSTWALVGIYGASHRIVGVLFAVSMLVPQAVFPGLARTWRRDDRASREALDRTVRWISIGLIPLAAGVSTLAPELVSLLFHGEFGSSAALLSIGIWRLPIFLFAYLYLTALVAVNRETRGVRLQLLGALAALPLVFAGRLFLGPAGALSGILVVGIGLWLAGYVRLRVESHAPVWHHHALRPAIAALVMVVVCQSVRSWPLPAIILAGAVSYGVVLMAIGGLPVLASRLRVGRHREGTIRWREMGRPHHLPSVFRAGAQGYAAADLQEPARGGRP